jgi:hypothetical protein
MGSPQPADLSKALDGLLTGLDSLMSQRDRPPVLRADRGVVPEALQFLPTMTALAVGALQSSAPAGVAEASLQVLRQHLSSRLLLWNPPGQPPVRVSPRWALLLSRLPAEARLQPDADPRFLRLEAPTLPDLAVLRDWAGPVGQTLHRGPQTAGPACLRLPALPECGGVVTVEARGHAAARWSPDGPLGVFFWLDGALDAMPDAAGLALVGEGRSLLVLSPHPEG